MIPTPLPDYPWLDGAQYIVVVDVYYSRYQEVVKF